MPDLKRYEIVYTLSIEPKEGNSGFRVTEDRVLCKYKNQDNEIKELVISNVNGKIVLSTDQIAESEMDLKDIYRDFFTDILKNSRLEFPESLAATVSEQIRIRDRSTLLENYNLLVLFGDLSCYGDLTIYDFNPKLSKQAILMAGNAILAEEGWNLPIVLKNILDNDNEKREFINLVIYFLGFVKDLRIQKTADNRFFLELLETYSEEYLSAYLVSDGTINIANLIIALFFDAKPLTIIEEPEKNIHPHLISKVVSSMKDASEHKQIIATTHNPEMIRHADLNDVLLVFRDEDGFSSIIKPSSKRNVEDFLKNGMRLEDLYVDNLLEI